eukprot:3874521-Rhodomonas_salina.10
MVAGGGERRKRRGRRLGGREGRGGRDEQKGEEAEARSKTPEGKRPEWLSLAGEDRQEADID